MINALIGAGVFILLAVGFAQTEEDIFSMVIKNDTASTVIVKQCDVPCDDFHETVT